jgi:hypothetical protein
MRSMKNGRVTTAPMCPWARFTVYRIGGEVGTVAAGGGDTGAL